MTSTVERRAIITGASSGIGKETALAFAKAGISVALVSRSRNNLEMVAAAARAAGVQAKAYPYDLADLEQVRSWIEEITADFAPITILVNNAGIADARYLSETPLSDWQRLIDLNLTSVFQCIQGVLPAMRAQHRGTIVNVASIAAKQALPKWGAYSVSKAGMIALSKTLAAEESRHGIRVVSICPGAVNTPLWDADTVQVQLNRSGMLTPEIVAQSILHTVELPQQAVIESLTLMPSAGIL
ncbi:MAG: SDR family oxidoreductase [Moorea sp. SIO1F2]|uniref:SDR family oxidoreductase n=1 Tax=unclassified Moorena TaxID=2683338 RepID=UPI0013B9A7DA|nr:MULTISPECIES: SDR family oxidoreductase [unclassified Moorena]NEO08322.1 SDR family oxidoreductase [Moorena sp. SIO3I8]NEP27527.1 SDR family oxidoreductase [Moorena sp. SIO3I6]NEQ61829.1 SDR family oxidoreductase [Moorena sp. SIO4A1]NET83550.1 SDR family oxidoreductase [Moorena sp. SIO1F2]